MTARQRIAIALLAIAVLTLLLLGCTDNWDGMDRSDWDWDGPTPTPAAIFEEAR